MTEKPKAKPRRTTATGASELSKMREILGVKPQAKTARVIGPTRAEKPHPYAQGE